MHICPHELAIIAPMWDAIVFAWRWLLLRANPNGLRRKRSVTR